ncbi:recombinase family protein [Actinoplanes sp. NPDC049316]|uniref:recombinase family protein n=1 Tax=Actinoplanes sp. NPDC049316 TaxID=3154727 RepID=UPI003433041F
MGVQARDQGRYLGGRPPYGYRLVDAGPHPNRIHAQWGRRLHRLDPDPVTAPHVRWIFARRLAGASTAGIARDLNERHVPSPSAHDPERNTHRIGTVWTLRTVAEILANPRYTGRQVWNRQRTEHHETVPGDKRASLGRTRTRNPRSAWAISREPTHPALVSDSDFLAAQQVNSVAVPDNGAVRAYLLTGLVICRLCGRRLEAHWVHGRAGYRCRHGRSSARADCQPARGVYWAEGRIVEQLLYQLIYAGELPFLADGVGLVAYLRGRRLAIVCGPRSLELEPMDREKQVTPTAAVPRRDDSGGG